MRGTIKGCLSAGMLVVMIAATAEQELRSHPRWNRVARGWILCDKKPLPKQHIQADGLNPHGTGSYLVVHDTMVGDFVLQFDYKLSKGCNSGVFLRTSDLKNPVNTGIEVALDDTTGKGFLYDSRCSL